MNPTAHGPKPGPKKQRPTKPPTRLQVRSLSDFPAVIKPVLVVVKVHHPAKHYRLAWQFLRGASLCRENQIAYTRMHGKGGVLESGKALAEMLGVKFKP